MKNIKVLTKEFVFDQERLYKEDFKGKLKDEIIEKIKVQDCDFKKVRIDNTIFKNCIFEDCRFENSVINRVSFENCIFDGTTDFKRCDIINTLVFRCVFEYLDFRSMNRLKNNLFEDTKFEVLYLKGADIKDVDFKFSSIESTDITPQDIENMRKKGFRAWLDNFLDSIA